MPRYDWAKLTEQMAAYQELEKAVRKFDNADEGSDLTRFTDKIKTCLDKLDRLRGKHG